MSRSRVVIVRAGGPPRPGGEVDPSRVGRQLERGLTLLTGERTGRDAVLSLFRPGEGVGIKINTLGGRALSTRPEVSLSLGKWLAGNGLQEKDLIIWDRSNRELREAGYRPSSERNTLKIFGTDTDGVGYTEELVSHLNIGSRFSTIQTDRISASISLAVLKDHGMAGVTAGMKNYFGAIHNPNKYHDSHCNPYVAEVFDCDPVKTKHRLSILDCQVVQYHRGPAFHPQWAERFQGFILSRDPVAADSVGWALIERLRAAKGVPSLKEEGREPAYLATAEKMGLGWADAGRIETVEEAVS